MKSNCSIFDRELNKTHIVYLLFYIMVVISIFNAEFLEHLAAELSCEVSDIEKAIASFGEAPPVPNPVKPDRKKVPAKEKPLPAKGKPSASTSDEENNSQNGEIESDSDGEKHTCDRIPRGKTDACGKSAKNRFEGDDGTVNWYCGTEKSGCFKSILLGQKRQTKLSVSKSKSGSNFSKKDSVKAPPAKKPSTNTGRKIASNAKTNSLLNKVSKRQTLDIKKIKVGNKVLWVDIQSRVLFDRGTQEAYAVLAKDNKTIQPLSDENIRWLEASGISIRIEESGKKADLKKKLSKKAVDEIDDEEELDKLRSNVDNGDTGGDEEDIDIVDDEEDLGSDDSGDEDIDIDLEDEDE